MTVQIKPSKPKDQHNGLADIEQELLSNPGHKIFAIVTYEVDKRVEDLTKGETYPVLGIKHIEPIVGDLEAQAIALQGKAYQARTGENELDLNFDDSEQPDDDESNIAEFPAGGTK